MSSTPRRPGPAAYATVGAVISAAPIPVVIRIITTIADIHMSVMASISLTVTAVVLFVAAPALLARVIVRYFRAARAEDRAEIRRLWERIEEIENQRWWDDPKTALTEEDTVELGPNVRPFRRRDGWTDRRSS